jgi:tRNA nucleotidyltransferase/poly(A) polymerase
MPDYIYLLENRLSADQQNAIRQLREATRESGMLLFLTGDAVRDLTSGHSVRELEISVHGNALKLKKTIQKLGGKVWGEEEASRRLFLCFPGTVRVDVVSAHRVEYPKPGKPVYHFASIQEDLRRRDFTVNAMAISLNEGSFGLLMDPLNGAADIEARTLRLVSNYGFLEEPALMIRATRYLARLGWELDPKTRVRYDNAKSEGVIEFLSTLERSRELEQIGHEEEALKVLRALEEEGWMKVLFPAWTVAKADEEKLKVLHDLAVELILQGVHPDMSAAQMELLTAKLAAKEVTALKKLMLRPGFVEEWDSLDALAAGFQKVLTAKENGTPSKCFKLFKSYDPEAILWLGFTSKNAVVQERFNNFLKVWPEARQRIPHALMQEMRITPELAGYNEIIHSIFLELIDGKLTTPEEMRAFLEPHSPPAPPPQVTIKRPRVKRGAEAKAKERSMDDDEDGEESLEEDLDDIGGDEEELDLGLNLPKVGLELDLESDGEEEEPEGEEPDEAPAKGHGKKAERPTAAAKTEKGAAKAPAEKAAKPAAPVVKPSVPAAKAKPGPVVAPATAKPAMKKPESVAVKSKTAEVKPAVKASAKPSAKAPSKAPVKAAAKKPVKAPVKKIVKATVKAKPKTAPARTAAVKAKPVAKSVKAAKPAKKSEKKQDKKPAKKAGKKR